MTAKDGSYELRDEGQRITFGEGSAQREPATGKGRYALLWMHALQRVAVVFEKGAGKYGDRNWEAGMPLSTYFDSAMRHLRQYVEGDEAEDHLGQALWNIGCLIETEHWMDEGVLPETFRDLPNLRTPQRPDTWPGPDDPPDGTWLAGEPLAVGSYIRPLTSPPTEMDRLWRRVESDPQEIHTLEGGLQSVRLMLGVPGTSKSTDWMIPPDIAYQWRHK